MNKKDRIIIALLVSMVFYLQSILSLLLSIYAVSWFWLDTYVLISAMIAGLLLIYSILEAKFGKP